MGRCVTKEPQRHLRTISWLTSIAGSPLNVTKNLYGFSILVSVTIQESNQG